MDKSNTNLNKIFDKNNENIRTIEKLSQVKISDLSTILYLYHRSEVIIRQYSNVKNYKFTVKHWKRMIKCHHKLSVLLFFRDLLNETDIANVRFTMSARTVSRTLFFL